MQTDIVTLYMTAANEEEAVAIAQRLLDERLIACANILPGVRSLYRWQGQVQDEGEVAVLMKTRADLATVATARIAVLHSYDVPCVAAWPAAHAHLPYIDWVRAQTGTDDDPTGS